MNPRKRFGWLIPAVLLGLATGVATAQPFPSKPMEFVVHVNPGGGTDVFARLIMEIINREKLVSQPIIVQSRTGGAGAVAFNYVKGKRGDPHTVLTIATGSFLTATSRPDLDLGPMGYPGCTAYFPPLATFNAVASGLGTATLAAPVPNNQGLIGTVFYTQWITLDALTSNVAVTNYGRVQLGL